MLSVMIVDDQISCRTDLKTMIDWEKHGYYIQTEANNGLQALDILKQTVPDILFTDINMPVLNGVGLIDYITQNYPNIYVIAISAYDDFDFVRTSMMKGAQDYVLKHQLDAQALIAILSTATSSIRNMLKQQQLKNFIEKEHSLVKNFIDKEFIHELLFSRTALAREQIMNELQMLGIRIDATNLLVTVMEIDDYQMLEGNFNDNEIAILHKTILEITKEILLEWDKTIVIHENKGRYIIVFSLGHMHSKFFLYNKLYNILNRIRSEAKKITNTTLSFGVSRVHCEVNHLHKSYQDAMTMLQNKFFKGKNGIYIENSIQIDTQSIYCLDIKDEKVLIDAIKNINLDKTIEIITKIFEKIAVQRLSAKSVEMVCIELITLLVKVTKEYAIEIQDLTKNQETPFRMIQKFETLIDMKDWVVELYTKLVIRLKEIRISNHISEYTKQAITFIQAHYMQDISLQDVANAVGVSASYVSRLFKEECQVGFAEYLNRVRIDRAKKHMDEDKYKIKEIIELVGFNNYNYFFKVFKEHTGMSPLEYKSLSK